MTSIQNPPEARGTFLYRDCLPAVMLDDGQALLFHLVSGAVVRASQALLPTDGLYRALSRLGFFDPPPSAPSKDERLARLCLIMTAACNMRCVYCYNDAGRFKSRMPPQVARAAIDAILRRPDLDYLLLQFYGGEPTLNPGCLQDAITYALKTSRVPVLPFVITNGLMNRRTLDFLIRSRSRFVFSCELIRSIHDLQRPTLNGKSGFEQVMANIRRAVDGKHTVSIRSVITNHNVSRMVEMVGIAAGLGVQEIILGPCEINVGRARYSQPVTRPPLAEYIHNYRLALRESRRLGIRVVDHLHRVLQEKDPRQSEIVFVLPDGSITQNTTVLDRQGENADRYITGAVDLEDKMLVFDAARRERLQAGLIRNRERFCRAREQCALLPLCQGRYKAFEFTVEDEPPALDTFNCEYRKAILADYLINRVGMSAGQSLQVEGMESEIELFSA